MDETTSDKDMKHAVQEYRKIVLLYEAVDQQIDQLFSKHRGGTDKMSEEELTRYRQLARQRDELLNEMRIWEQHLLIDDVE